VFSLFSSKPTNKLSVNDGHHIVNLERKETILAAALRSGIPILNSCRVGGCAICKCKLIKGYVKELTDSSYVLSQEELDQGYILACQSVPKSNVEIAVLLDDMGSQCEVKKIQGVITAQQKLTHDITCLKITLNEPIDYASGQYAELNIPVLCSAVRAYSFATPASGNQVEFYIRDVTGGELSPLVNSQNLLNTPAEIRGPFGDFYLRDSDAPIICIAGGSGLAPIKALLEQAFKDDVSRDVVFYFGARTQQDLYCTEDILALEKQWNGTLTYIPVLSHEPKDSVWQGHRGFVTEILSQNLTGSEHAYLCGPPMMIDTAIGVLIKHCVPLSHIHFDKFLSKADLVAAQ
jgi:NAD(P)H-flavin reductase/ferredoxin